MAEATLFVSSPRRDDEAIVIHVDRSDLNKGVMTVLDPAQVEGNEDAIPQVACGYVAPSQWATIVEANIDEVACGNVCEGRYKFSDVLDEQIAHLAGRHPASVHMRFDRAPNVGRRDQNAQVRQLPRLQSLKPIPYGEWK